jgi:CheY-like chemotaxis protein
MQVLIVDESQSCKTLRSFLTELDYRLVVEASTADLALKILNEHRSRIRLVISELQLPGMGGLDLLKELRTKPWADFTGFVLTSSDVSQFRRWQIRATVPRPGAHLAKPFRRSDFDRAINRAMSACQTIRDTILYVGDGGMAFYRIQAALKEQETHWSRVLYAGTLDEVRSHLENEGKRIAGVFIDPTVEIDEEDLGAFFRHEQGPLRVFVYLSHEAPRSSALRERAEIYFEPGASAIEWRKLLRSASVRVIHAWELEHRALRLKHANQEKRFHEGLAHAKQMLRVSRENSHTHTFLGECYLKLGKSRQSRDHLVRALELNPCAPHPYLTLLSAPGLADEAEKRKLAERALHFCPKHPGILKLTRDLSGRPDGR